MLKFLIYIFQQRRVEGKEMRMLKLLSPFFGLKSTQSIEKLQNMELSFDYD